RRGTPVVSSMSTATASRSIPFTMCSLPKPPRYRPPSSVPDFGQKLWLSEHANASLSICDSKAADETVGLGTLLVVSVGDGGGATAPVTSGSLSYWVAG